MLTDITLRGFWMSRWMSDNSSTDELSKMYDKLTEIALARKLTAPKHKCVNINDYRDALAESMNGFKFGKIIFKMD